MQRWRSGWNSQREEAGIGYAYQPSLSCSSRIIIIIPRRTVALFIKWFIHEGSSGGSTRH